jgi:CrcB protein
MTDPGDALDRVAVPRLGLSPATIAAIAIGGALGTVARYLLDATFNEAAGHFPTVTLLINLSGSLAIGFLIPLVDNFAERIPLGRPLLIVGILGGWTTYSTLAVDAVTLAKDGHAATAALSLATTVIGGLFLVALGNAGGRAAFTRPHASESPGHR